MYHYIKGELISRSADAIVVEQQGIGYEIGMPSSLSASLGNIGDIVKVYTVLFVREADFRLFGFVDREQRALFLTLTGVSGIGPKLALAILDQLETDQLALAVLEADIATLTRVKGLGKKGAERLIIEIRDKLKKQWQGDVSTTLSSARQAAKTIVSNKQQDVLDALLVLGYNPTEAEKLVVASFDESKDLSANIQAALKCAMPK